MYNWRPWLAIELARIIGCWGLVITRSEHDTPFSTYVVIDVDCIFNPVDLTNTFEADLTNFFESDEIYHQNVPVVIFEIPQGRQASCVYI